ncbi:uncharacterized protein JCM6883_006609 [Sporobolomyces salmoneus]|uniref:uncharacterized protein n=1 Tax=Sporobolomyces salmoneus TaxID=183962 RepID=UPI0031724B31
MKDRLMDFLLDQGITGEESGHVGGLTTSARTRIDYLSRLPVELLNFIFELAAPFSRLTTRPISKGLLPSQERAIYRTITLTTPEKFGRLMPTLRTRPRTGQQVQRLVWRPSGFRSLEDDEELLQHLPNLIEMQFDTPGSSSLPWLRIKPELSHLVPFLRTCRFTVQLDASDVDCLSRIPSLRLVEVSRIQKEEDARGRGGYNVASQVLQVAIRSHCLSGPPSRLVQFFPSASIPFVDVTIYSDDRILPLFAVLDHRLVSLQLKVGEDGLFGKSIDHLLPRFSNLRHLHLDSSFLSPPFQTHLLTLSNLASLSLAYYQQIPDLRELLGGLERIPNLYNLTLTCLGVKRGEEIDMEEAEEEFDCTDDEPDVEPRALPLLENLDDLVMRVWELSSGYTISDVIRHLVELQNRAQATGLLFESNLPELERVFRFQLVEYYNRAVANLYFRGGKRPLEHALSLLEQHNLVGIELIEINLEEDFATQDLVWYLAEVGAGSGDEEELCGVYGLRRKKEWEYGYSEKKEEGEEGEEEEDESESWY